MGQCWSMASRAEWFSDWLLVSSSIFLLKQTAKLHTCKVDCKMTNNPEVSNRFLARWGREAILFYTIELNCTQSTWLLCYSRSSQLICDASEHSWGNIYITLAASIGSKCSAIDLSVNKWLITLLYGHVWKNFKGWSKN